MEYDIELLEAVGVVVARLGAFPGENITIKADLVAAALERRKGIDPSVLMNLWNRLRDPRLPACVKMTATRKRHATARLREFPKEADWVGFMNCINNSKFLLGETTNLTYAGWHATFDWFITPKAIVKFKEGVYNNRKVQPTNSRETYSDEIDRRY